MSPATKQVLVIRRDLRMRRGKEIGQGAHAASMWMARRIQHCVMTQTVPVLSDAERAWIFDELTTKIVLQTPTEDSLREVCAIAQAAGLRVELITDAGKTEFDGVPTATCCAIGPDECAAVDRVTGPDGFYGRTTSRPPRRDFSQHPTRSRRPPGKPRARACPLRRSAP